MTLYQNKYRVETSRLQNWDYTSDGIYFITICTKDRENIFGEIEQGKMQLNNHGRILEKCWFDLPEHYSNLILDAFVVMPNHFHAILIIDNMRDTIVAANYNDVVNVRGDGTDGRNVIVETGFKPVSTMTTITNSQINPSPDIESVMQNQKKSTSKHGLFEFVRALKTFSSRRMNELDNTPGKSRWQQRYYDRIVRDENELNRIRKYIINNPAKG